MGRGHFFPTFEEFEYPLHLQHRSYKASTAQKMYCSIKHRYQQIISIYRKGFSYIHCNRQELLLSFVPFCKNSYLVIFFCRQIPSNVSSQSHLSLFLFAGKPTTSQSPVLILIDSDVKNCDFFNPIGPIRRLSHLDMSANHRSGMQEARVSCNAI